MSIKIWLDDVRLPLIGWTWVKTVAEAKQLFLTNDVEDASFDNDLGGGCEQGCWGKEVVGQTEMDVPKCDLDICNCNCHVEGYELVDWLKETNKWPKRKPTVHSSNVAARARMQDVIDKAYPSWMSDTYSKCHRCGHRAASHGRDLKCFECNCKGLDFV